MNFKLLFQSLACILLLNSVYSTDHPVPDASGLNDDNKSEMISVAECEKRHATKSESKDTIKEPDSNSHLQNESTAAPGGDASRPPVETTTGNSKHHKSEPKHDTKHHGGSKNSKHVDESDHTGTKVIKVIKKTKYIYSNDKKKHKKKKNRKH